MKKTNYPFLLLLLFIISSCGVEKKLVGLWQIEKVRAGEQEMTPIARWTKLNADHSQESGNGWFQHSIGNWQLDAEKEEISIITTNGLEDEYGGFEMRLEKERMIWQREEEGELIEVVLKRIDKIPQAPSNQLLGAWRLKSIEEGEQKTPSSNLFIRWDRILVSKQGDEGRKYATYKTHGHKNELQIIYYEDPLRQEIWNYTFTNNNTLLLSSDVAGERKEWTYERVSYFPN